MSGWFDDVFGIIDPFSETDYIEIFFVLVAILAVWIGLNRGINGLFNFV